MLTFREKLLVTALLLAAAVAFVVWINSLYIHFTVAVPKKGGTYTEGVVGQPMYVNPLLSQTSDADSDLSQLVFAGLFKYDADGNIVPDMASSYELSDDHQTYTVHLKQGLLWHDGKPLNADDVVFTYSILQDPIYKSPLRQNWQGVDVVRADDSTVMFALKKPYFNFLENLTVGILPKHVWENVVPEKFALAEYNLRPIGSGPYMFSDIQKDPDGNISKFQLVAFKGYNAGEPNVSKLEVNFYPDDDSMLSAYNKNEIMGMGSLSPDKISQIKRPKSTHSYEIVIPRYFALFFNQTKNAALANADVRKALSLALDRSEIIDNVLKKEAVPLFSPMFPQMDGYVDKSQEAAFDVDKANKMLDDAGWKRGDDGVRKKGDTKLSFTMVVPDWPELSATADVLKSQWQKVGADVSVDVASVSDLQQNYIRTREYDSLLFGQAVSFQPDFYSFWHSSNKRDPGQNFAMLDNKDADTLLENLRIESDLGKRRDMYGQFQQLLSDNAPALFLYSRYFIYPVNNSVQGISAKNIVTPSQRFAGVEKWYVKTSRVFK